MYYVLVVTTTQFYIHTWHVLHTTPHTHTHVICTDILRADIQQDRYMSDRYNKFESFWFLFFFHVTTNVLFQLTLWALGLFVTIKRLIIFAPIHLPPAFYCL